MGNLYIMKLWIISHKNRNKIFYRFLERSNHVQTTGVKERAALFLDMSAAQDVCDELFIAGHKEFIVIPFEDA